MTKCKSADKYKAIYYPKCKIDDKPCETCMKKWQQAQDARRYMRHIEGDWSSW